MHSRKLLLGGSIWLAALLAYTYQGYFAFKGQGLDFSLYYSIGELFDSNTATTMYAKSEQGPFYGYSPFVAPFFYYLALIPFTHCKILFFALKPLLLATWPLLLALSASKEKLSPRALNWAIFTTIAVWPAIYEETIVGNINLYLVTFLFAATVLAQRGMILTAATVVTVIATFKPQYSLFFIPILLLNPKRAIGGGLLGLVILVVQGLAHLNPAELVSLNARWLEMLFEPLAAASDASNMSTNGVLQRILTPLHLSESGDLQGVNLFNLSAADALSWVANFRIALAAFCLAPLLFTLKSFHHEGTFALWFAWVILLTLIVTPVIWETHYMLLAYPLYVSATEMDRGFRWQVSAALISVPAFSLYSAGHFLQSSDAFTILARAYGWPYWALIFVIFVSLVGRALVSLRLLDKRKVLQQQKVKL
ncbi:MAG: glycosyltransferase 87 family protein [Proteobacteria bacterium]|nr:glycosyltransferase 87 family protein [Pseudomonadota bacterium]